MIALPALPDADEVAQQAEGHGGVEGRLVLVQDVDEGLAPLSRADRVEQVRLGVQQVPVAVGARLNLKRREIEELLKAYTGARTVIWLGQGYQDDHTDGHVDEVACFVRPGVVMALATADPRDGNFVALQDNLDRLKKAHDASGRPLEVIPIRQPARRERDGVRLTLSYTNLYIGNRQVIMPGFEDSADQEAYRTIRRLFPNREVIQVPALDIVAGGGGIHCITQQQPAPAPIPYDPVI